MDTNAPRAVGIIMDGNRRWAKARGRDAWEGHQAGKETVLRFLSGYSAIRKRHGVVHYTFYTFSTENWKRSPREVKKLLELFNASFDEVRAGILGIKEYAVSIRFIGDLSRLPARLQEKCRSLEEETKENRDGTITFAVSYGGRAEIMRAIRRLASSGISAADIDENSFPQFLDTAGMPDPELIIRTGGSQRLSNFLTWQSAYSELMFTPTLWPDFTEREFESLLSRYEDIQRNFGS